MPGLVPGIHVLAALMQEDVDGRDAPGHDEKENPFQLGKQLSSLPDAFSAATGIERLGFLEAELHEPSVAELV